MKRTAIIGLIAVSSLLPIRTAAAAPSFLVEPYLQNPSTDGMTVMWETMDGGSRLEYWKDGQDPVATSAQRVSGRDIYYVTLSGLDSNRVYNYRAVTDQGPSTSYKFKTWPAAGDGVDSFKMVLFSDSQGNWPDRLEDICTQGIIDKECTDGQAESCPGDIAAVLVVGDLVSDGEVASQWREEFFGRCRELFHYVPVLPAIGNHDLLPRNYLDYFTLPTNGTPGREEQWYYIDLLNTRLITLFSSAYTVWQWVWFDDVLDSACADPDIDYVLAQFHYPCRSEVWPPGEDLQACIFDAKLTELTRMCGKPSGHFFGHTHAYSRGQSRDVPHIQVNVATSAGGIDHWGEYEERDYDEFQVSYDEYGFSVLHVTAGEEPALRMVRRTGGDDSTYHGYTDDTIQDDFSIEASNRPPENPEVIFPADVQVDPSAIRLRASAFADPDGDFHLSTHWQISTASGQYGDPVIDAWGNGTRFENIWRDEDTQAGADITTYTVDLQPAKTYYLRVRYRDEHLGWSDWSGEATFHTNWLLPCQPASTVATGPSSASVSFHLLTALIIPMGFLLLLRGLRRGR